ncbi:MAG: ribonuclease D, partial [Kistimonas sp.]|nr:ribonuclease D [Kistimonas sp.]
MPQPHIHWITDDESLVQAAVAWHQLPSLAMDTEFKRTSTFWPQTGLIQAAAGEKVWLIDPMHINCWQPLRRLLESRDTIKIMHAMSQDLEIFHRLVQAQPVNLFDTQLAAAYAGLAFSISYQRLVAEVLGVHLTKNETRSDWLARPLTPHQIHYAAQDVFYLAQLLAPLSRTLKNKGYEHWHREDCERQVIASIKSTDPATAWMRVKNARNLNRQQQHILQVLCQWREQQAQQNDISRNFLIPADALWHLAKTQPDSLQRLKKVPGMNAKTVRTLGPEILHQISLGHKR